MKNRVLKILALSVALMLAVSCMCGCGEKKEEKAGSVQTASKADPFRQVGSYVTFGHYEQDGNESNGKEPIEWLVLDYDANANRVLLISRFALDQKDYNDEFLDITWEKSTLRGWMNNEFFNAAFDAGEQKAILTVDLDAEMNAKYETDPGNATRDKVFCMSITEAEKYFKNDNARRCLPTKYAVNNGTWTSSLYELDGSATCKWWLRVPGVVNSYAASVTDYGDISRGGDSVCSGQVSVAVRPAIWIDLALIP